MRALQCLSILKMCRSYLASMNSSTVQQWVETATTLARSWKLPWLSTLTWIFISFIEREQIMCSFEFIICCCQLLSYLAQAAVCMTNLEYARKLILGTDLQRNTHICTFSSLYCWKKPLRSINKVISLRHFKILISAKTKSKIGSYSIRDPFWAFCHQRDFCI